MGSMGYSDTDRARVQSRAGVTLVGAGELRTECLEEALKSAPCLVAADGGADFALAAGHVPEAVIGDLDSLSAAGRTALRGVRIIEDGDQDTTDFEKCLARIEAPFVLAVGFAGARLDHTLAAFSALARHDGPPAILMGEADIVFRAPPRLALDLPVGMRLSLFPMAPASGRSSGLRWPIGGVAFAPHGRIGTSNEVTGPVRLEFGGGPMLVILPRPALGAAKRALTG